MAADGSNVFLLMVTGQLETVEVKFIDFHRRTIADSR